jgi:hypothetical protein
MFSLAATPCQRRQRQYGDANANYHQPNGNGRLMELWRSMTPSPTMTLCDDTSSTPPPENNKPPTLPRHELVRQAPHPNNPYKQDIERLQKELDQESCQACLYTGVATCMGLAAYFAHLATEDSTLQRNRRFLWICSAGSLVAGAYRWHLG